MSPEPLDLSARATYDTMASAYDVFNKAYQYESWTGKLLAEAQSVGLEGNRLLDIGCGTGLSFVALLDQGFEVTACDISPGMLEIARRRAGDRAELLVGDMRELPDLGEFDLVWAVNDAVNYVLSEEELLASLRSMVRNLSPGGVVLFDLNTLLTFKTFFCETHEREVDGQRFIWRGEMDAGEIGPGAVAEAHFEAEGQAIDHVHRQRHFPEAEVLAAIADAGLRSRAVLGELDGVLSPDLDESVHTKAVYIATR
ncbi:MAG TPA: class I SAM-dependent methyltransferase [Solirubrobacterales bacterium]|nr:class I SAM-dependent methyltransferase [Solirubrobacterales bacterium]